MKLLSNEQGSTSVLIIVLMIVLMAFGVAALTTAHAGLRLTERNAGFTRDDYALEAKANTVKYDLLTLISDARDEALQATGGDENSYYVEVYHLLLDEIYLFAGESTGLEMAAFEEDLFLGDLIGGERIGTFHYHAVSDLKEDKLYLVELDVFLPDYEGTMKSDDILVTKRWQLSVGSVGEAEEDLFFEDPFEDPFEDENLSDDDSDPFN